MTAIHTESAAIFGGMNVNEAELKIQYIKYRPSLPYNSKSPITFTIPGNTTPYVSLRDSYLFVQCHVEETDEYGNPSTTDPTRAKRSLDHEGGEEEATPPSNSIKKDDEEDPHSGRRENGSHSHRGIAEEEQSRTRQVMASDVEDYLEEAERRWRKAQRAWTAFCTEMDMSEKAKKHITAKGLEDRSVRGLQQYLEAKYQVLQDRGGGGWSHNSRRQCPALHVEWSRYYHEWRTRQYHQSKVHVQILHRNHLKQQSLYQGISTEIERVFW